MHLDKKALRKRKADDPPIEQSKLQATHQSVVANATSALRTAKTKHQKEQPQNSCSDVLGDWQPHSWNFIQNTLNKLKSASILTENLA